jgi:hypothetical protein
MVTNQIETFAPDRAQFFALADRLVERFYRSQEVDDLYAAVIVTSHVVDWCVGGDLGKTEQDEIRLKYPEWGTLKELSNGFKHGLETRGKQPPSSARLLRIEGVDSWSERALDGWEHAHQPFYWAVEHGGRARSVTLLCQRFLHRFAKDNPVFLADPVHANAWCSGEAN